MQSGNAFISISLHLHSFFCVFYYFIYSCCCFFLLLLLLLLLLLFNTFYLFFLFFCFDRPLQNVFGQSAPIVMVLKNGTVQQAHEKNSVAPLQITGDRAKPKSANEGIQKKMKTAGERLAEANVGVVHSLNILIFYWAWFFTAILAVGRSGWRNEREREGEREGEKSEQRFYSKTEREAWVEGGSERQRGWDEEGRPAAAPNIYSNKRPVNRRAWDESDLPEW